MSVGHLSCWAGGNVSPEAFRLVAMPASAEDLARGSSTAVTQPGPTLIFVKLNENRHRTRGYLLQEVIVGLVIFAIAMLPILRALVLVPRVAAANERPSTRRELAECSR